MFYFPHPSGSLAPTSVRTLCSAGKNLQRCIGTISYKTLSSTLKELEKDRLVVRKEYPQIPPKVEYSLSERGRSLIPVIDMMCNWGEQHRPEQPVP